MGVTQTLPYPEAFIAAEIDVYGTRIVCIVEDILKWKEN